MTTTPRVFDVPHDGHYGRVLLDGVLLENCYRCCPAEGWADCYQTRDGAVFLGPDGELATVRVKGTVGFQSCMDQRQPRPPPPNSPPPPNRLVWVPEPGPLFRLCYRLWHGKPCPRTGDPVE